MANLHELQVKLGLVEAMWADPKVYCYQNLDLAPEGEKSIFLAGPSSRDDVLEFKWRIFACQYLRRSGFDGVIYIPEPRQNDWSFKDDFPTEIVEWESERLLKADVAFIWIPRHQVQLPGRVTNTEIGFLGGMAYVAPDKFANRIVWGYPIGAWKTKAEHHWIGEVAGIRPHHDLSYMCGVAAAKLAES